MYVLLQLNDRGALNADGIKGLHQLCWVNVVTGRCHSGSPATERDKTFQTQIRLSERADLIFVQNAVGDSSIILLSICVKRSSNKGV